MGGKLYLAAYAQGLGASGLTFFDDDVTEFFSPHAAGKSVMFLLAIGKSVKVFALFYFIAVFSSTVTRRKLSAGTAGRETR